MSDQDNNFYLTSLIILITCLLANVWILEREVTGWSLLGVKGLIENQELGLNLFVLMTFMCDSGLML